MNENKSKSDNRIPVIDFQDVTLGYTLYFDQSLSIKEYLLNLILRRKYTQKSKDIFNALSTLSLKVYENERVGIIGRNGAGKSTLLKVISRIIKPTSGRYILNGSVQPLIEIAAGFNPEFSGRENIYLNGYMLGFNRKAIKQREQEIIDFSEIGQFIDTPVKYYSSGMTLRLAFTIATSIVPDVLVFDELLSTGDAAFLAKAKNRLDHLMNSARAIILVSHDLELIEKITNRVLVMDHGKIIFDGNPRDSIKYYLALCATEKNEQN